MNTLLGNATKDTGEAVDLVRIFRWPDKKLETTAVPDAAGDWTAEVSVSGEYGVTYIAAGCQPITHGPYYIEVAGDTHWDKVVALLHFDDEADPWKDETGKIWEPIGIVEHDLGKWGKSVGSFVNSSDKYLRCPNTDGVFNLPGQFTFECWFQHTNSGSPYRNIFLGGSSSFPGGFAVTVGNKSSIAVAEMYGQNVLTAPFTVGDAWYFLAVTRDINNIVRLFIDGVLISQALSTSPLSFSPSGHAHILNHLQGSGSVGRVDELRITKGVARYTENFTPPTEPFPSNGPA